MSYLWMVLLIVQNGRGQPPVTPANPPAISQKVLKQPQATGGTHAVLVWVDTMGKLHKAMITQAEYDALKTSRPARPPGFQGNNDEWNAAWDKRLAWAGGGRPTVNTKSGEPDAGDGQLLPDGRILIYTGDIDIDPIMPITPAEYTGTFPNINLKNKTKCGITITGGQISGQADSQCIRSGGRQK